MKSNTRQQTLSNYTTNDITITNDTTTISGNKPFRRTKPIDGVDVDLDLEDIESWIREIQAERNGENEF